jgi:hypothetical protein
MHPRHRHHKATADGGGDCAAAATTTVPDYLTAPGERHERPETDHDVVRAITSPTATTTVATTTTTTAACRGGTR